MQITRVYIKNIGVFKDLVLTFDPKINLISGENGSGKSTIVNAIGVALFGLYPTKLENLISSGESNGHIVVDFTHNGKDYQVIRDFSVGNKTSHTMVNTNGNEPTLTSSMAIFGAIEKMLPIDLASFRESSFYGAGNINKILLMTPSEKRAYFSKLFNLQIFNNYDKHLLTIQKTISTSLSEINGYVAGLESVNMLDLEEVDLNKLENEITDNLDHYRNMSEKLKELNTKLNQHLKSKEDITDKYQLLNNKQNDYFHVININASSLTKLEEELAVIDTDGICPTCGAEINSSHIKDSYLEKIIMVKSTINTLETESKALSEQILKLQFSELDVQIADIKSEIRAIETQMAEILQENRLLTSKKNTQIKLRTALEESKNNLAKAKQKQLDGEKVQELIAWFRTKLKEIPDYLLVHYLNEIVSKSSFYFSRITDDINYLQLNEDLSIVNGYGIPDHMFSSGEVLAASISLRMAINDQLVQSHFPIFLDEPTHHLSNNRSENFMALLKNYYIGQVFLISHNPALSTYVDNIIEL